MAKVTMIARSCLFTMSVLAVLQWSARAFADVPAELYPPGNCHPQPVVSQQSDGQLAVVAGIRCRSVYKDYELIELQVRNNGPVKEIFVYDRNFDFEFARHVKFAWGSTLSKYQVVHGAAFYLGKGARGTDRIVIALSSERRNETHRPIDIYVKMNSEQRQTLQVQLGY